MNEQMYQGDVSIIKINSLPKGLKFKKLQSVVVAEGEVTGHKHLLVADKKSLIEIAQDEQGNFYMKVDKGTATITHQEHKPVTIEQGVYFVGHQWEYDPLAERKVID